MTIQIGHYKVKIQAEDRFLTDMPKAEATKYFLNELSVLLDRAADNIRNQEGLDPETRQSGIRLPTGCFRDLPAIGEERILRGMRKTAYDIEIREGDSYYSFYSLKTGRWISGCKKAYLLDVMNELTQRFYDLYGEETYFKIGGYENDEETRRRLQNGAAGARFDR